MAAKPEDPRPEEGDERLSRRSILQRIGGYSVAVVSLLGGGGLAAGCGGKSDGGGGGGGTLCRDSCEYANDGECDDGAEGALYDACDVGTDCSDCGPRPRGTYADLYGDAYSNSYGDYADYADYSNYSNYYNYSDYYNYYNSYYNYSDYVYYYNVFVNSW